jgi:hypothetical protein
MWFIDQSTTSALKNDFNFIKELIEYKNINKNFSEVVIKTLSREFWNLSET